MKALLLAAGRGTRISRNIEGKPKCTLALDGHKTLIEYSVDLLEANGITDITIVIGYRGEVIRELFRGRAVTFVENPFYDVTNSIASLWFARAELGGADRFTIMNADVFLSPEALALILEERRSPVLFYDRSRREGADYKFLCEGERIVKYGKELSLEETSGEYVGCASFDRDFLGAFATRLDELIQLQRHGLWWEDVLYSMSEERPVLARDLAGAFWGEVDYIEDYERIMEFYRRQGPVGSGPSHG
jgi:choline kinase